MLTQCEIWGACSDAHKASWEENKLTFLRKHSHLTILMIVASIMMCDPHLFCIVLLSCALQFLGSVCVHVWCCSLLTQWQDRESSTAFKRRDWEIRIHRTSHPSRKHTSALTKIHGGQPSNCFPLKSLLHINVHPWKAGSNFEVCDLL